MDIIINTVIGGVLLAGFAYLIHRVILKNKAPELAEKIEDKIEDELKRVEGKAKRWKGKL